MKLIPHLFLENVQVKPLHFVECSTQPRVESPVEVDHYQRKEVAHDNISVRTEGKTKNNKKSNNNSEMVTATDMLRSALDQLLQLPHVPKSVLLWLPFLYFFFPLVAAFESARMCLTLTVTTFLSSVLEFVVEWSNRRRDQVKLDAASRAVRERFDALWRYVIDSARWMFLAAVVIWLGLTFFTAFLTLYVIYLVAVQRHHSFLTSLLKKVMRRLLGLKDPLESGGFDASTGRKVPPSPAVDRTTSLKGGSHSRCKVIEEGPHFNRRSRGCLL